MAIDADCEQCGRRLRVADQHAGKTVACPNCKSPVRLPRAAEEPPTAALTIDCAGCGKMLRVPARLAGKQIKCPNCGGQIPVTSVAGPTAKPPAPKLKPSGATATAAPLTAKPPPPKRARLPQGYAPVLTPISGKASLASTYIHTSLNELGRGNEIVRSELFQYGEARSFWEKAKAGIVIGPLPQRREIHIDQVHLMTISDPSGEFHAIVAFDNGVPCPVEFLSVIRGRMPTSLGLLRGEGGPPQNDVVGSVARAFLPPLYRTAVRELGSQANGYWSVLDPNESQEVAEAVNCVPNLTTKLRFDGSLGLAGRETTYHLNWLAQALPMGPQQYLLVAKFIPANKALGLLGFDLGVNWFIHWRDQFLAIAGQLPNTGMGRFCSCDFGACWGAVAYEVLHLDVLSSSSGTG